MNKLINKLAAAAAARRCGGGMVTAATTSGGTAGGRSPLHACAANVKVCVCVVYRTHENLRAIYNTGDDEYIPTYIIYIYATDAVCAQCGHLITL